ncbi:methylmalonic aciduria and homocystinuria type D protein [Pannus brasiliensis CCIBt3594]|uniref:Methylmalonic aciduria and homocystinuria type D protein n=1 Tax=Pannus brasiliensis CCIBt3594 TaxID=1427578 RepID=A0AAW9QFJ3_9CHRO
MNDLEIYPRSPTPFILENRLNLLPECPIEPRSILIIILHSRFPLDGEGESIDREKDRCLQRYLAIAESFRLANDRAGFGAEIISPKNGFPLYSARGKIAFDTVAIVHQTLGFDFDRTPAGCKVLKHPSQGSSVYPGLFLSSAESSIVPALFRETLPESKGLLENILR